MYVSKAVFDFTKKEEEHTLTFKVFYPIPICLLLGLIGYLIATKEFELLPIAIIGILAYLTFNTINQKVIMKEIIKEIEKD